MEKILTTVVTIALTCTMGFAHEAKSAFIPSAESRAVSYENTCPGYVDIDNDGICDNCNIHHSGSGYTCSGYADIDNDGICDNCSSHHSGSGSVCSGYVDADNDGFCDNHTHGEYCPYTPSATPDDSGAATQSYSGGHHRNSGHHGRGHH
ncbi:MAG: hypothetical protein K2K54_08540 [Lachnospiraceae bacterium]|nr:hypothetical protein [Lachnospiraceae bacterium]